MLRTVFCALCFVCVYAVCYVVLHANNTVILFSFSLSNTTTTTRYDLDGLIPGMGVLEIQVRHKKLISSMEIGRTLIDLEDRWFSPSWQGQMSDQRAPKEVR